MKFNSNTFKFTKFSRKTFEHNRIEKFRNSRLNFHSTCNNYNLLLILRMFNYKSIRRAFSYAIIGFQFFNGRPSEESAAC